MSEEVVYNRANKKGCTMGGEKKRLEWLDVYKGFLILLVIWAHVVQKGSADFFVTVTYKTIYSFHMAAFFFISGWLLSSGRHGLDVLPRKVMHLLVPYFAWFVVRWISLGSLSWIDALRYSLAVKGEGLWFLRAMGECILAAVLCDVISPKRFRALFMVAVAAVLTVLAFMCSDEFVDVRYFAKYYQYFIGGFLLPTFLPFLASRSEAVKNWLFAGVLSAFVIGLVAVSVLNLGSRELQIVRVPLQWLGCVSLFAAFQRMSVCASAIRHIWRLMMLLGRESLGLYAVHVYLIAISADLFKKTPMIVGFIILVPASLLVVLGISKIPFAGYIFLGKSKKRVSG